MVVLEKCLLKILHLLFASKQVKQRDRENDVNYSFRNHKHTRCSGLSLNIFIFSALYLPAHNINRSTFRQKKDGLTECVDKLLFFFARFDAICMGHRRIHTHVIYIYSRQNSHSFLVHFLYDFLTFSRWFSDDHWLARLVCFASCLVLFTHLPICEHNAVAFSLSRLIRGSSYTRAYQKKHFISRNRIACERTLLFFTTRWHEGENDGFSFDKR